MFMSWASCLLLTLKFGSQRATCWWAFSNDGAANIDIGYGAGDVERGLVEPLTRETRFLGGASLQRLPRPEVETSEAFSVVTEHRLSGAVDTPWPWMLEESARTRDPS